jgi:hypothetical protein
MARYKIIACHVLWREISYYASQSSDVFDIEFLEQGLHCVPDQLRDSVQQAIDAAGDNYDAILLGYGLCSNGIEGIVARDTKLVVAKGHDCITYLLGSKERYREYFDANPGTYWYSPGWIDTGTQPSQERYERTHAEYVEKYGEDNADYLMGAEQGWFREYSSAAYVDLGFGDNRQHKQFTKTCAEWLKWKYEELTGDPSLILRFLAGDWKAEDFLVVEPGQTILASHDDAVLKATVPVEKSPPIDD